MGHCKGTHTPVMPRGDGWSSTCYLPATARVQFDWSESSRIHHATLQHQSVHPANTRHSPNVVLMLCRRRRRGPTLE